MGFTRYNNPQRSRAGRGSSRRRSRSVGQQQQSNGTSNRCGQPPRKRLRAVSLAGSDGSADDRASAPWFTWTLARLLAEAT